MLNNFMCVGRIANDIEIKEEENGKKYADISLSINRNYKNENGIYESDIITVKLYDELAINVNEYCRKYDFVGIKGRIETRDNKLCLLAERVTFLKANKTLGEEPETIE